MIKNFKYLAMAAAAAALCSAAACAKINGGDDNTDDSSSNVPGVELVNEADKEISTVAVGLTKEVMLVFSEGLTKENVTLKVPSEASDWCTASFSKEKDAILLSTEFNMEEDRSATISVVDIEDDTKVYLTFTVKSIAGYFKVTSNPAFEEGEDSNQMTVPAEHTNIVFTIETNLGKWYAFAMDAMASEPWIHCNPASGSDGETCTVTIDENKGSDRMAYFSFSLDEPGEYGASERIFFLLISQQPGQGSGDPSSFKVSYYDEEKDDNVYVEGNVLELKLDSANSMNSFEIEYDGGFVYACCLPGTDTPDTTIEGEDYPWVMIQNMMGFNIIVMPNTGAARATDLVIYSDSTHTTELFRFKITQEGAAAAK